MASVMNKLKDRVTRVFGSQLDASPMWFLAGPSSVIDERPGLTPAVRQALHNLRQDGFTVLQANNSAACCDAVVSDFANYCQQNASAAEYRDDYGLHSRLALLHYVSDAALDIAANPRTLDVVRAGFLDDYNIAGSLFFERGSTQSIHRDTPAFFTNPLNRFFGVWNALEDIGPGTGELCYYPGGHRVISDAELRNDPRVNIHNYFDVVEEACVNAGLAKTFFRPNKGDTLIWLPQLPHGGGERTNPAASRRSIVFHYIPRGVPIYGAKHFFDRGRSLATQENYDIISKNGVRMIDMGSVRFYHNHAEGNFEEG